MKRRPAKLSHRQFGDPYRSFDYVRDVFFPKWDRRRKWKLCVNRRLKWGTGQCHREHQTIEIGPTKPNVLLLLIIHEICHAAASPSHGQRWKGRLLLAAQTAAIVGMDKLAEQLRNEVTIYDKRAPSRNQAVYADLESIAISSAAPPKFEQVLNYLLCEYKITEVEFRKHCPRAEKFYREACEAHAQG